jgi:hypothetical protein
MEFKNIKKGKIEHIKCIMNPYKSWLMDYKHQPQKKKFTIVFRVGLWSYLRIVIIGMKRTLL